MHREYRMPINLSEEKDTTNLRNAHVIFFSILPEIQLLLFQERLIRIRPSNVLQSVLVSVTFLYFLEGESSQTIIHYRTLQKTLKAEDMLPMIWMNAKANDRSPIMGM